MDEEKKEKDPAFQLFSADFLVGTMEMSMEERGQYITLLCLQHQKGHLNERQFAFVGNLSSYVLDKFEQDENGLWFNARLDKEIEKRERYKAILRQNGAKGGRPPKPKENQMVSENETKAKPKENLNESTRVDNDIDITNDIDIGISNKEIREMQEREEEKRKIVEIITYLNSKLNSRYTFTADYINKHIRARLSEGFTVEDFKTVIDKKHREWSNTEMAKFLRPETLFGTKFQQYLNQPDVPYVPKTAIGRCGVEYYVGEDATTDLDGIIGD